MSTAYFEELKACGQPVHKIGSPPPLALWQEWPQRLLRLGGGRIWPLRADRRESVTSAGPAMIPTVILNRRRRWCGLLRQVAVAAACGLNLLAAAPFDLTAAPNASSEIPQPLREELDRLRREVSQLKDDNSRLQEEVLALRRENQQLRRLLAQPLDPKATNTVAQMTDSDGQSPRPAPAEPSLTHWLSTLSGKRHNPRCRYFGKTAGQFCGPDEGTACKLCGG